MYKKDDEHAIVVVRQIDEFVTGSDILKLWQIDNVIPLLFSAGLFQLNILYKLDQFCA